MFILYQYDCQHNHNGAVTPVMCLWIIFCPPDSTRFLIMESRFAHLRQRDSSVSMLRVKMSRRRSQSQKENRDRALNSRRPLEKLQEMESSSLDVSTVMTNMSTIHEKTQNAKPAKSKVCFSVAAITLYGMLWNKTVVIAGSRHHICWTDLTPVSLLQMRLEKKGRNSFSVGKSARLWRRRRKSEKRRARECLRPDGITQRAHLLLCLCLRSQLCRPERKGWAVNHQHSSLH